MMNSKSKPNLLSYIAILGVFAFTLFQYSCTTKVVLPESSHKSLDHSPWTVHLNDLNDPSRTWKTATVIDTIVTIDYDTYEEQISFKKTEYQYTIDTIIVMDGDTFEETISIVKTYRGAPPGFFGI